MSPVPRSAGAWVYRRALPLPLLLGWVCGLAAQEAPLAKTRLAVAWPSGPCVMTVVSRSDGTTTVGEENSTSIDNTTYVWQMEVGKADAAGEKKLVMRLVELHTEGNNAGEAFHFDSTAKTQQDADWTFVYGPLAATPVTVTLDADDTVVEVSGLDKLWDGLATKDLTDNQKILVAAMKVGNGDKFIEYNLRRWESLMPKSAVGPGDKWKAGVRFDLPVVGELKARFDCSLSGIDQAAGQQLASIEAAAEYSQSSPKTSQISGLDLTLQKVTLEEQARLKVEPKTGRVVSEDCTRTAVLAGKATEQGAEHKFTSKTTTHIVTTITPGTKPASTPAAPPATPATGTPAPATPPPDAPAVTAGEPSPVAKNATGARPVTIVLRRQWEPKQRAFTVLVPLGWQIEGGLFSIDPTQGGGALNSVETKCDFSIKRDAAGSVMVRWAPTYNFADFSRAPEFASIASLFPPGRNYNGALVMPMPTVEDYLTAGFRKVRPGATAMRVTQRGELPELAEILQGLSREVNAKMAQLGKPPMIFTAGCLVFDYTEAQTRFREAALTALCDWRATAGIWSNQFTFHMRAPADEADTWKPVLEVIRQSLKFNPEWLAAYAKAVGERGAQAAEVMRYLARVDQEIFDRRAKTRSANQHENYLLLSGQEEYVNPFTRETERDTSDYKQRWTNAAGDRLYSNTDGVDPNQDPNLNQQVWKQTLPRPR
ncbi:MAG: DUF6263 family protein [Verrucomicrobia bacterium]|nr:DUF6263 family protein [Verrucomicrobiota bacterium]